MTDLHRELTGILIDNWCSLIRAGAGRHEIWYSPVSRKPVTVPRPTTSRHAANEVLKQSGLPKQF